MSRRPRVRRGCAALLGILALGLLVACGAESDDSDGAESSGADGKVIGEIEFWVFSDVAPAWEGLIADFENKHPGANVVTSTYGAADYDTKLLSAFSSGGEPDVFYSYPGEYLYKFVGTGKVAALDDMVDLDLYNPAAVDTARASDGKLYGLPSGWYVLGMWANKDLLSELGVEQPETWDDLLAACRALTAEGVIPIALGAAGQDSWTLGHWYSELVYQYAGIEGVMNATYGVDGASWTDEPFVEAAVRFRDMLDAGCFPERLSGLNFTQMKNLYLRGEAAMTYTGTWLADNIRTGGARFQTDVFKFPLLPGASHDGLVGGVDVLAASERAMDEKATLVSAFLNFVGQSADARANETSRLSVAADPKPQTELLVRMTDLLKSADELGPVNDVVLPAPVIPGYLDNLLALAVGELAPEEFGQAMADFVEKVNAQLPELE